MKAIFWIISALLFLGSCATEPDNQIVIENESSLTRVDAPIVIKRETLEKKMGTIPEDQFPMFYSETYGNISPQTDDTNGDGTWDELFFLVDMEPQSERIYNITLVSGENIPVLDPRSNARLAEIDENGNYIAQKQAKRIDQEEGLAGGKFQMEGPAWENDLVGFRNYLDYRNGIDIFGKTTTLMSLDSAGIDQDYHQLQKWGMDILKVGTSLGAGSLAIKTDEGLYPVGPDAEGSVEIVADGPLRSVVRFYFDNWEVEEGKNISLVHTVSIYGGAWYYVSDVEISGNTNDLKLVTGIATLDLDNQEVKFEDFDNGYVAMSTFGRQSIEKEYLGMGLLIPEEYFEDYAHTDTIPGSITDSFIAEMSIPESDPLQFMFYATWELSNEAFASGNALPEILKNDSEALSNPIKFSIL
ncbi:MAG: DUF4861 family protein [Bacteroidota bacterium]